MNDSIMILSVKDVEEYFDEILGEINLQDDEIIKLFLDVIIKEGRIESDTPGANYILQKYIKDLFVHSADVWGLSSPSLKTFAQYVRNHMFFSISMITFGNSLMRKQSSIKAFGKEFIFRPWLNVNNQYRLKHYSAYESTYRFGFVDEDTVLSIGNINNEKKYNLITLHFDYRGNHGGRVNYLDLPIVACFTVCFQAYNKECDVSPVKLMCFDSARNTSSVTLKEINISGISKLFDRPLRHMEELKAIVDSGVKTE